METLQKEKTKYGYIICIEKETGDFIAEGRRFNTKYIVLINKRILMATYHLSEAIHAYETLKKA